MLFPSTNDAFYTTESTVIGRVINATGNSTSFYTYFDVSRTWTGEKNQVNIFT